MRKILKLIFILISLVIVLFAGAAVALVAFFDPNDFKPTLTEKVREATGRELTIDGELELSLFPWLGIKTGALSLGNPEGFKQTNFAQIDAAEARAKLLPLLSGELEMDTVVLKGLELNLVRLRNGKDNWSDLGGKPAESSKETKESDPAKQLAALAIGGIDIEDASLTWDDQQNRERIELSKLKLETGALELGAPMAFSLKTNIKRKSDGLNGSLKADSVLRMNPFEGRYKADNLNLGLSLKGKHLPGGSLDAALRADVAADLIRKTVSLERLELSALTLQANGKLSAGNIFGNPTYKGELSLKQFNPRTLMALMGTKVDMADPKALTRAQFDVGFDGNTNRINLNKLSGKLDDTSLSGTLSVTDIKRMAIRYDLKLDQVDLDRYRGAAPAANTQAAPAATTPATVAAASAPVLPVELLRNLNINGKVQVGKLRMAQIDVTDISMTAKANAGDMRLYPVKAKLSGGSYDGNIHINVKGKLPVISVNEQLTRVETGPLVKTFAGYEAMQGVGNIVAKMTTRGNTDAALRRNLNGILSFSINNGVLKDINIDHLLRTAYALKKGRPAPNDNGVKDTYFSSLSANSNVTNGVLDNRDLRIESDNLRIKGKGRVNLVNESMKYRMQLNLIKSYEGPSSKEFDELKRISIPLIIQGPFNNLSKNIDFGKLLEQELKRNLEKKIIESLTGKKNREPTTSIQQPAKSNTVPQPKLSPEEERRRRKEEERRQKEELFKKILGL